MNYLTFDDIPGQVAAIPSTGGVVGLQRVETLENSAVYLAVRMSDFTFFVPWIRDGSKEVSMGWDTEEAALDCVMQFWNSIGDEEQAMIRAGTKEEVNRMAQTIQPQLLKLARSATDGIEWMPR